MAEAKNIKQCYLKVEVYEKHEGEVSKTTEFCVNAQDSTLEEILKNSLSTQLLWKDIDPSTFKCHSENFKGQLIDLSCKPREVRYIDEALRNNRVPLIIIYKETSEKPQRTVSPNQLGTQQVQRTLSSALRFMINKELSDPSPLPGDLVDPINEDDETVVSSGSIRVEPPSGSSSGENSPEKKRKFKAKSWRTFEDRAISMGTISSQETNEFNENAPKSNRTLPHQLSQSPTTPSLLQKRKSVFNFRGPTSPPHDMEKGVITSPIKEISGPLNETSAYDWKNRQKMTTLRTTGRKKQRYKPKTVSMPGLSYSSYEIHQINIQPEDDPSFDVKCREFDTVGKLRQLIKKGTRRSSLVLSNTSELIMTYEIEGTSYELFNDSQFIYKTALYEHWRKTQTPISVHVDMKQSNWELPTLYRFSKLTGVLLDDSMQSFVGADASKFSKIAKNDGIEVQWTRRTLHSYVDELVRERDPNSYALSVELDTGEIPMLLALKIPFDNKIEVTFHYKVLFSLVKRVRVNQYASSILQEIFPCVLACGLVENEIEKYTLQTTGEQSYLDGENELITFKDIRRCILKNEPIHISIATKPTPQDDAICSLNWVPIDPYSSEPPLHSDISKDRENVSEYEIFGASTWDQQAEFGVHIMQAENLPIPTTRDAKKLTVVVEVTLYHANQVLKNMRQTKPLPLTSNGIIEWIETVSFDLQIRNLPKAAKIMVVVRDFTARKESVSTSKKKQTNILYWGLVPVFDHRGILQTGLYTMNLWKGPVSNSKIESVDSSCYDLNPCAPCNNNPDSHAVKVTIQFPRYTYPVFFPSSDPETCSYLLSQEKDSVVIRKQFEKLLKCLSDGQLPMSAFPSYIARIEWAVLPQVIEVYALLQQVEAEQNLPVETTMKLLDGEFADEKVRAFAVRVLDTVPDDQLEDFLLQLTQALKFEPCHDSALARFLLKRALNNKRIGHFFFWYLKCELYNPLFTPRFGVLLEAYLKGCGEAMLRRFENQVDMQQCLEEIGGQVEERGGNDAVKMQILLQDLLEHSKLGEQELTPVYNPRIILGQLDPTKCKIMASKKRPQWLDMRNVNPTSLKPTPTRLILKLGDDLRQDVIVLRMLSLFQKLWEREGLPDLCLIPYGCMATGPNTGFIEVVKNARTIADVSGINDQKKLYEWIRSHQKNEFGEDDPDKLKDAVRRFTHSCAGYTVASYVLGIGDRHNDNVMITSSGNLFHIDFGHFLGNIKYFLGLKREWAPFVLTPDFVYVMGGEASETFNTYKNLCCRAFLCLRRHHELIFNLFSLMKSTGIPELACVEDANYIRDALMLTKPEHDAEQDFRRLIKKCLDLQWTVQIMWWIHKRKSGTNSS